MKNADGLAAKLLWEHPNPQATEMWKLIEYINAKRGLKIKTFDDLYQYSVSNLAKFWLDLWEQLKVIFYGRIYEVVDETARIDSIPEWFRGVRLNFTENILFTAKNQEVGPKTDSKIAVTEMREGGSEIRHVSWKELRMSVGRLSQAMKIHGIQQGDRIAVIASNSLDTLEIFLATAALGAIFSSTSTDMGVRGILDRLIQIKPSWVFMDDFAMYNGRKIDQRPKMRAVIEEMRNITEFQGFVSLSRLGDSKNLEVLRSQSKHDFLSVAHSDKLIFNHVSFSDPLLIVYSSGTSGPPKCIVHSVGGVVASSGKEGKFHRQMGPETVLLQYTTTSWIMYLSSVTSLIFGARVILYDGSPFYPSHTTLIEVASKEKVTVLGISPRFLYELRRNNVVPREFADLSSLKIVTSTGMVLSNALFEWFYDSGFPKTTQLANISGGTDLAGCFGLENPLTPVYVGGCQGPALGTCIAVFDPLIEGGRGIKGAEVPNGVSGELVAIKPFPNMPVKFWGLDGPKKYQNAYFAKYDNVWTQGDFVMIHPITKGIIFLGRADGVLNPSGVRFGSSEIYGVLEKAFPQILDSICVGQRRPQDSDEAVLLFVIMKPGHHFTDELSKDIKEKIGKQLSPRHVPKYIFETPEIPMTVNMKKVELPIKQIVSGEVVKPSGTLLNPGSLQYFYQFANIENFMLSRASL